MYLPTEPTYKLPSLEPTPQHSSCKTTARHTEPQPPTRECIQVHQRLHVPLFENHSSTCHLKYCLYLRVLVVSNIYCSPSSYILLKSPKALKPSVVMTQLRQFEGTRREWLILQECFGSRQHCVSLSILPSWWTLTSHNYMFLTQMHTWVCFISQTDHQGGSWATQTPSHQIFFRVLT